MVFSTKNSILSIAKTPATINNPPTVKLLTSCQIILPAWCCLPSGTRSRSLFEPSSLHAFYLLLRGLVLFVPDSLPPVLLNYHVFWSSFFATARITSVSLQHGHCSQHEAMQGHPQSQEIKMKMTMTAEQSRLGEKDNYDNDNSVTTLLRTIIIPNWHRNRLRDLEEECQQSQCHPCLWGSMLFSAVA
jgi:hypothetical protein